MGSPCSTCNKDSRAEQGDMQEITIDPKILMKAMNNPESPAPVYAKISKRKPAILPAVESTISKKWSSSINYDEEAVFELVEDKGYFYQGNWKSGKQDGKGRAYHVNGTYFEGEFVMGHAECSDGIFIYPDGSFYKGEFKEDNFEGKGVFVYSLSGMTYEGQWQKSMPNGEGEELYADGGRYKGQFLRGKKHGKGVYSWADGKTFEGDFQNGQMHGDGILRKGNGEFQGKFQNGYKVMGSLKTAFGEYRGKFLNGEMHDNEAQFCWNDGRKYKGSFEFGQFHGSGEIEHPNGALAVGKWNRGENMEITDVQKSRT